MNSLPQDGFRGIVLDPNWGSDAGGGGRGANEHYELQSLEDIIRTVLLAKLEDGGPAFRPHPAGCLVACWATALSRRLVPTLFSRLGVRWTPAEHVWIKGRLDVDSDGSPRIVYHSALGMYGRSAHELTILGVTGGAEIANVPPHLATVHESAVIGVAGDFGSAPAVATADRLPTAFIAPARGKGITHSSKPDEFFRRFERMVPNGELLSMYERHPRGPRWHTWGDQAPNAADLGFSALDSEEDADTEQTELFG